MEKKQYGWFWVCPNGGKDCHYRHALPPGYVLKSQMKALLEEETEKITIEEEIENQASAVLLLVFCFLFLVPSFVASSCLSLSSHGNLMRFLLSGVSWFSKIELSFMLV